MTFNQKSLCETPKKAETKKVKKNKIDKENKENSSEAPRKEVKKRNAAKKEPVKADETVPLIKTIVKELKNTESSDIVVVEAGDDKDATTATKTPDNEEAAKEVDEIKTTESKDTKMETDDDVDIIEYCFNLFLSQSLFPFLSFLFFLFPR